MPQQQDQKPKTKTNKDEIEVQLHAWAHTGDLESVENLKKFIAQEQDEYLKGQAECALDEAYYFYYGGFDDDEQAEKDFLLAKLIKEKEWKIINLMGKIDIGQLELDKLKLENLICKKVMKESGNPDVMWFNYIASPDYEMNIKNRLQEIKEEISYLEKWVEFAKREIKLEKYKTIPDEVLSSIHLDGEGGSFWEEDE